MIYCICLTVFSTASQTASEDFSCSVYLGEPAKPSEVVSSLSASVREASRDPETGVVTLGLTLVYAPLAPCR